MRSTLPSQARVGAVHLPSGALSQMKAPYGTLPPVKRPVTQLPVELVIHIIRSGLDLHSQRSLSQVSRAFRDISFLIPEFWSTVVPKFPLEQDQLDYWKRSIVNSKAAPLDITLTIPGRNPSSEANQSQGFRSLFLELAINAARWRTFELVTEDPAPMDLFLTGSISVATFPQLENLRLACAEPIDTRDAAWFANGRHEEPSPVMPRLRNLTLWNVWARYPRGILNDLVDLKLLGDLLGITPPLEDIVDVLKSSPNLEVLSLTAAPPLISNLSPPPFTNDALHVVLPRLRSLTFRGLSRMAGISILPLLHLPALEVFRLENTLAWLERSMDVPSPQIPEDYSSVIQIIAYLNMPWERSTNVFVAPPGPQWPQGKLKELTLSWVTAEAMHLLDWLSFMHELTTLRTHFSDVDLFRVLQDERVCPQLQALYVEGFIDPATSSELERVMHVRPNLEVSVEAIMAGTGHIFYDQL